MNIEIISGSSRENSTTLRVAIFLQRFFAEKFPQYNIGLIDLRNHHFPFVDKVYSTPQQAPEALQPVAQRIHDANAFVMVTPEYNGTFSPSLANLFDHFPKQAHKVFGLVTASVGPSGGLRAALALQHFVLALFGVPSSQMLITGEVESKFDKDGTLVSEKFQSSIDNFVAEFIWLAEKLN